MSVDPEYFHSADIIEFFWFGGALLMFLCTAFRVFRLKEDLGKEENPVRSSSGGSNQRFDSPDSSQPQKISQQEIGFSDEQIQNNNDLNPDQININQGQHNEHIKQDSGHGCIEFFEKLVLDHYPFLAVSLLSVVIGEAFIFCAFMATFYLFCIMLINGLEIFKKYDKENLQDWMNHIQGLVIITFFFNFWF